MLRVLRLLGQQRWQQLSLFDFFSSVSAKSPQKSLLEIPHHTNEAKLLKNSGNPDPDPVSDRFEKLCHGVYADIRIIAQTRMRKGWKMEWRRGQRAQLTLSKPLQQAPDAMIQAVLDWALLAQRRQSATTKSVRRKLENQIHAWIESHPEMDPKSLTQASGRAARYLERLRPQGKHHDLESILNEINSEYFKGELKARITWSSRWGGLSTQSLRKDAAGKPYHLLMISRGYDHPSATPEIVGGVVYHECLHIVLPPEVRETEGDGQGRRTVHSREFRRREKEYRHYEVWRRWHRESLPRLLRRRP